MDGLSEKKAAHIGLVRETLSLALDTLARAEELSAEDPMADHALYATIHRYWTDPEPVLHRALTLMIQAFGDPVRLEESAETMRAHLSMLGMVPREPAEDGGEDEVEDVTPLPVEEVTEALMRAAQFEEIDNPDT